jgi:hypothetical protein
MGSAKSWKTTLALSLYVTYYNLCRVNEALSPSAKHQATPPIAFDLSDPPRSIGELLASALTIAAPEPDRDVPIGVGVSRNGRRKIVIF